MPAAAAHPITGETTPGAPRKRSTFSASWRDPWQADPVVHRLMRDTLTGGSKGLVQSVQHQSGTAISATVLPRSPISPERNDLKSKRQGLAVIRTLEISNISRAIAVL